jgi:hypothetical protein
MLLDSFRFVTSRLIPRPRRCKQALVVAVLILAGCGGSSEPKAKSEPVKGNGFRFQAPAGWKVAAIPGGTAASRDSEMVQVAAFPLVRAYDPALFDKVASELAVRMQGIAQQTGGTVSTPETVTAGGIRSHSYRVKVGDHVDQYTFVLRGKREYQLLCRRRSSSSDAFCAELIKSFSPA